MLKINFDISKKTTVMLMTGVFLLSIDRFFKFLAINQILPSFNIFNNLLVLRLAKNYNIAFSLPLSGPILVIFIFLTTIILIFFFIKKWQQKNNVFSLTLFFIILGSSSNLFDRIKYGFVIDYLDLKYFTVFNIADGMISCGAFILAYMLITDSD